MADGHSQLARGGIVGPHFCANVLRDGGDECAPDSNLQSSILSFGRAVGAATIQTEPPSVREEITTVGPEIAILVFFEVQRANAQGKVAIR